MERSGRPRALAPRLPPSIDRADVGAIVERCRELMATMPGVDVDCDAAAVLDPRLPTVEVIALLALAARRNGHVLRLEGASPELLELLALCGLAQPVTEGGADGTSARPGPASLAGEVLG